MKRASGFYWVTILKGSKPTIAQWTGWHWFPHGGSVQMSDYSLHEIGPRIPDTPEEMKKIMQEVWESALFKVQMESEEENAPDFDEVYKQLTSTHPG